MGLSADDLHGDGPTLVHAVSAPTGNLLSAPLKLNHRRRSGSASAGLEDGLGTKSTSSKRRHHLVSSDMSDNSEDSEANVTGKKWWKMVLN